MNFHPHPLNQFPSQTPPIHTPTHGLQSLYPPPPPPPHSHQPLPPPKPPINPHLFHLHPPINPPSPPSSDYQQRLREEVIYLHSLWHIGPPRPPLQPHSNPTQTTPSPHYHPHIRNPNYLLKPNLPTTPFKKKAKKNKPIIPKSTSDKEWPVLDPRPTNPPSSNGWGQFKAPARSDSHPVPAEEQERVLAVRVHLKGLDSFVGFFNHDDDDGDGGGGDEEEEEYDEEEVFEYFWGVFERDEKLREYYKSKCENGEFYCLVCGVIAKQQLGRKYKNCVALVQHSVTISKAKRKVAHRAFGRAVCKVLGWDIDQLPSIASSVSCVNNNNNNNAVVAAETKDLEKKPSDSETPVSQDNESSH